LAQNHHLSNLSQAKLAKEGVMVRHYEKEELKNFIRISVGRPEQTDTFLSALAKVA
jgi:histidinol-phosphate aminotransferase